MPRRPTRTVPTLLLHGLGGPGPQHWYTWLADELRAADRVAVLPQLPRPTRPRLDSWLGVLHESLADLPEVGFDVVAHSLGSVLWLHHASGRQAGLPRPARVALVAPPDPTHIDPASFLPVPLDADAVRRAAEGTVLVGSDDDPACPAGVAAVWGAPLKMPTTIIEGGGHLNPDAGYGPWPAVLDWCRRDNLAFIA